MAKLTKVQCEVLSRMSEGWQLRYGAYRGGYRYIRHNEQGKLMFGNASVASNTQAALRAKGFIEPVSTGVGIWRITDAGRLELATGAALAPARVPAAAGKGETTRSYKGHTVRFEEQFHAGDWYDVFIDGPDGKGVYAFPTSVDLDAAFEMAKTYIDGNAKTGVEAGRIPPPKPTTTPALAPVTERVHTVKLPTKPAPAPEPPAVTYGVLGNPSLDTIIAHLLDALECELSAEEDAWELTLRCHITNAIVETERLLKAQGLPLMWACVLDMLAGPQGWAKWQKKVAAWTSDPVSAFLETWYMDHPEIEEVDPDTVDIPTLPADWTIPTEWRASPMAVLLANTQPDSVQPPKLAVAAPAARDVPQTHVDAPAPRIIGQWYDVSNFREACRALKAYQHEFDQKPDVIKLPYEADKKSKGDDLRMRGNVLGVRIVFDKAVHRGKAWIGVVPARGEAAA